jgi:O-antigen/teichoic acid export membrane protein
VPFLFSTLAGAAPGWADRLVRQTYMVWGGLAVFFVGFVVATPIGYHLLVDQRYHSSMTAVFWLATGFFFNGIYLTFVDYIFYLKKTHILAVITSFNLVMNMGLAYFLIRIYGANGAAMAFAITAAIVMCLTFVISYRLHPMPWLSRFRTRGDAR